MSNSPQRWEAAGVTQKGAKKLCNEDAIGIAKPGSIYQQDSVLHYEKGKITNTPTVFAVADGLGAHAQADRASMLVVQQFMSGLSSEDLPSSIAVLAQTIHDGLIEIGVKLDQKRPLGASFAGIILGKENIFIVNVGDVRIYQINNQILTQLTTDDRKPGGSHSQLDASFGGTLVPEAIPLKILTIEYSQFSRFLILSDGVFDVVSDNDLKNVIEEDISATVAAIGSVVETKGNPDDYSIIDLIINWIA